MKFPLTVIGAAAAFCALLSSARPAAAQTFQLQSADISANQTIHQTFAFNSFGCTGQSLVLRAGLASSSHALQMCFRAWAGTGSDVVVPSTP